MLPVFPTSYFGSIRYFRELAKFREIIIEGHEHYPKQTLRNRTIILTANGLHSLSVPVIRKNGSKTMTKDLEISYDKKWQTDHWRAIRSAYESSPYFDYYGMEVEELIFSGATSLKDFNRSITNRIINWLDLDIQLQDSRDFEPVFDNDFRTGLFDKKADLTVSKAPYMQVFPTDDSFHENISILDAVFCEGPLARNLILNQQNEI